MAKKFDTNPLDPLFPEKVKEKKKKKKTSALHGANGKTRQFAEPSVTEEQTRKFDDGDFSTYGPHAGPDPLHPVAYQTQFPQAAQDTSSNSVKIGSISLPENILTALPYIPFAFIGLIAGIIELVFVPKSEPRVRYHAAQGIAAQCAVWIVSAILGAVAFGSDLAGTAQWIFGIVTTIMLLVFAFKAWQGKPIHIESVESLTDWFEEKIKPQS